MIKIQRHNKILEILDILKSVSISKLSKDFNCSEETIRKDLKELELEGKLIKTHGGAYIEDINNKGMPHDMRETLLKDEKMYMADFAIKYIKNNSTLSVDSSTTCIEIVKKLLITDLNLTIFTNSLHIANLCINSKNIKIILLPGKLNKNKYLSGYYTTEFLDFIKTDISLVSFPTIDLEQGFGDNTVDELNIRKKLLKNSRKSIVLFDHTKFLDKSSIFFTKIENIDILITDKKPQIEWINFLEENKIKVIF